MPLKPVLFITVPNVSLFMRKAKDATGLSLGASFVAGAVNRAGFSIDYFDFNMALNRMLEWDLTPGHVVDCLSDPEKFAAFYHGLESNVILDKWLSDLLGLVPPDREYLAICFSWDRRDSVNIVNKAGFSFALLLARELKKRHRAPVIAGGQKALEAIGGYFVDTVLKAVGKSPIDRIAWHPVYFSLGNTCSFCATAFPATLRS